MDPNQNLNRQQNNYSYYNQTYQMPQNVYNPINRIPINQPNEYNYEHQGIKLNKISKLNGIHSPQQSSYTVNQTQQKPKQPYYSPQLYQMQKQQPQQQMLNNFQKQPKSNEGFKRLLKTKYIIANEIGKGTFAKVFKGINSETGERVAIKKLDKNKFESSYLQLIDSEITVLAQLNNEHIIKFLDLYNDGDFIYIVTELCELGDLEIFIKKNFTETKGRLPEELVKVFTYQILLAFLGIADMNIIHRDMKLSNVLISKDLRLKVADFGLAKSSNEKDKDQVGTPMTMAPEILNNQDYGLKCDVWSVGCMVYEMLEGRPPFLPLNNGGLDDLKKLIKQRQLVFRNQSISCHAKKLIDQMLTLNPNDRISWHEMFEHDWFSECVSQGEPFIKKILLDYSGFVDLEEKHLDPDFAFDFGLLLRDFVNYHIDTFFKEIKKTQDQIKQFQQNVNQFPSGQNQKNIKLLQQTQKDINMLIGLLYNHVFQFKYKQQTFMFSITKFCKDQIQQRYNQQSYDDAKNKSFNPINLQESICDNLILLSQNIMTDDFEFFKCNFAPIVNLISILTHPQKGFLEEMCIDESKIRSDVSDRLSLINIQKAYQEEFQRQEMEIKKDILILNRKFIKTKYHEQNQDIQDQIQILNEIVFGYQQELIQQNNQQKQQSNVRNIQRSSFLSNY